MLEEPPNDAGGHDILDVTTHPETQRGSDQAEAATARTKAPEGDQPQRARGRRDEGRDVKDGGKDDKDDDKDGDEDEEEHESFWERVKKHKIAVAISLGILIIGLIAGIIWYLHARHFESTDDAFIDGRPVAISPEVTGYIVNVPVNDNQIVRAGDLLAEIDPRDYQAAVQQAEAAVEQAEASIISSRAQIDAQKAQVSQAAKQVEQAQASLSFAKDQDYRAQDLIKRGAGTVQNAQQTASDLISRQAALEASTASQAAAEQQVHVLEAQVKSNEAQLERAKAQKATADANMTRTQLHATVDGRVTRLTAALGAAASPGQALMILVPNDLWVTANYKETQLTDMRPGQSVDIEIDAYGRTYPGHVDSIQAGSGTAFSLLPAENATGNYVKVVQRIPVKLIFDQFPDVEIGPGMSVVPTVRVR